MADIVSVPFALYAQSSGGDEDWEIANDSTLTTTRTDVGIGISTPSSRFHIRNENPDLKLDFDNDLMQGSSEILFSQNDEVLTERNDSCIFFVYKNRSATLHHT